MNRTYDLGDNAILNCMAQNDFQINYQWQFNGTNMSGETNQYLNRPISSMSSGGEYTCLAYNDAGGSFLSTFIFITPYFTTSPQRKSTVYYGSLLTLTCEAQSFPAPQYLWEKKGDTIRETVVGIQSSGLSFDSLLLEDGGEYLCKVTSGQRTVKSNSASVVGEL